MRPESHRFHAMGTTCAVFAVGQSRARLLEVESWIRALADRFTRFSDASELYRLNARAGAWTPISGELEDILRDALEASAMSGGLVNVAVLPSMIAVGYTRPLAEGATAATLEPAESLPVLSHVLKVRSGTAMVAPGSGIDLGGLAKGWMADRAIHVLGENAVVNLGGDLMAVGPGPDGGGWPVGMGGVTLMLRDQGAATSSVRRRRWGEMHHLIDPRSGRPAETGLEEVSVVASSALTAEVVAKTALLLGPEHAPAYCAMHASAWWLGGRVDG